MCGLTLVCVAWLSVCVTVCFDFVWILHLIVMRYCVFNSVCVIVWILCIWLWCVTVWVLYFDNDYVWLDCVCVACMLCWMIGCCGLTLPLPVPSPDVKMWRESVSCVQVLHCVWLCVWCVRIYVCFFCLDCVQVLDWVCACVTMRVLHLLDGVVCITCVLYVRIDCCLLNLNRSNTILFSKLFCDYVLCGYHILFYVLLLSSHWNNAF